MIKKFRKKVINLILTIATFALSKFLWSFDFVYFATVCTQTKTGRPTLRSGHTHIRTQLQRQLDNSVAKSGGDDGPDSAISTAMSLITGNIKDVLSIKLKSRHDSYTDQFSRIFMAKMFIISSLIMSVDFFSDKVSCIVPQSSHLSRDFVHSACWIQGFYVFEEMFHRVDESGYYGIPKDVELDGIDDENELCRQVNKATGLRNLQCKEMTKQFYLQYQYFPFYIASLAILYYMPYMVFRIVNTDMISLRGTVKEENVDVDRIVKNYFNRRVNGGEKVLLLKSLLNLLIKLLYVFVTIAGFILTDTLLYGNYLSYGVKWVKWARLSNQRAHEYIQERKQPKPGNVMLPPMGFCEITEGSKDVRTVFLNTNKFICEISPNILYQYVLTVLWFMFITSIAISILGVLLYIGQFVSRKCMIHCRKSDLERKLYSKLTYREIEYLEFMRSRNLPLFGDVKRTLMVDGHLASMKDGMKQTMMNGDAKCHHRPSAPESKKDFAML